jgi:hypothetical protein
MNNLLAKQINFRVHTWKHWTPVVITQEFLRKNSNTEFHEQPQIDLQDYISINKAGANALDLLRCSFDLLKCDTQYIHLVDDRF